MSETQRPKLDLKANVPVDVRFRFSDPLEKEGQYGAYDVWTVEVEGVEHALFASNSLRDTIREASPKAGGILQITKTEREGVKGYDYTVERPGETAETPGRASGPAETDEEMIEALVGRYVGICRALNAEWPEMHEKDAELFKSAATSIFIRVCR